MLLMTDYISREDALNFEMEIEADPEKIQAISQGMALYGEYIKSIPAAEVVAKMPKWISVTERLPEIGKDVLCFCRANIFFVLGWDGNHWHEGADRYYMSSFVTHWMPLPQPPESEGE